jgi:hypothetical protein
MSIFDKLRKLIVSPTTKNDRILYLHVQCGRCGEKMRARVDLWNELSPEYDEKSNDPAGFFCRKVLVGERGCYQPIELQLRFDKQHNLVDQRILGGKYIDEVEFNR